MGVDTITSRLPMVLVGFFLVFIMGTGLSSCLYQQKDNQVLEGTMVKKEWSKSSQSYCAQGSEYYVLNTSKKEWVLQPGNYTLDGLALFEGQIVTVEGRVKERKIKASTNPMSQQPVSELEGDSFECEVFKLILVTQK